MRNNEDQAITSRITAYRFAVPPPKLPSVETMTLACKCVISNASYLTKQNHAYVVPAHQTSDMSRCMISPESRSMWEMVILSSLRFLTI